MNGKTKKVAAAAVNEMLHLLCLATGPTSQLVNSYQPNADNGLLSAAAAKATASMLLPNDLQMGLTIRKIAREPYNNIYVECAV